MTIILTHEEAQQVLSTLEKGFELFYSEYANETYFWLAIKLLRARLAQPEPATCDGGTCGLGGYCDKCPKAQPAPEPVAWVYPDGLEALKNGKCWTAYGTHQNEIMSPLYTAPPQRECEFCGKVAKP